MSDDGEDGGGVGSMNLFACAAATSQLFWSIQ